MRNEILRKITIVMAIALLLLTILTIVSFIVVSINDTKDQVEAFAEISEKQINKFETLSDLDKFILYKTGNNIRITIISSDGDVIQDTEGKDSLVHQNMSTNTEVHELLKENCEYKSIGKIESPYIGMSNMYSYYLKVETKDTIDPNQFLIVRFSMGSALGSTPFMLTLVALIGFWVVMVISLAIIFNFNIKAALTPLEKAQNIMRDIKNGNFKPRRAPSFLTIESEADKMVTEIEDIGEMINGSIHNLKMLIDSIKQGVIAFDKNSKMILKNDKIDKLLGFSANTKAEFYAVLQDNKVIEQLGDAFNRGKEIIIETEYNNKHLKIETIVNKAYDGSENGIFMLIVLSDITQEKNDEKFKNEFFANASHELKTPLTAINGYSEMMTLEGVSEKQIQKCAQHINKNALRMRELIEDMLNLSKLENIKNEVDVEEIQVENIVETLIEELKVIADKRSIKMGQSGKCSIVANKKLIIMLIKNLITNAIKYNKDNGSITISLSDKKISVKDTGVGIDKENIEKIFDRFYKVENPSVMKNVETSSGLGLALVSEIAKIHNAKIEVFSELDKGSEFVITFKK